MRATGPLTVSGLEVRYGELVAVRAVSFDLAPGRTLAVTGPAGAGKSSLLWGLAGATPYVGTVRLAGTPLADRTEARAHGVWLVPQGNGLAASLTAEENVVVPLVMADVSAADARRRTAEAFAAVGLEESGNHLVEELSGGQQQRVAVARAIAGRPNLLLADEPTSDLDTGTREFVVTVLLAEAAAGAIVIVATHDPEIADALDGELGLDDGEPTWLRR